MSEETATESPNAPKMPDGFQELSVSGQQAWVSKAPGVTIRGILKGRHKRPKGKAFFYRIEITGGEVPAVFDKEETVLTAGDVVCIDETKALEVLRTRAEDEKSTVEAWIQFVEKVPNQNDPTTSFWRMKVGAKTIQGEDIDF